MNDVDRAAAGLAGIFEDDAPLDRVAQNLTFGEGPVWDWRGRQLFWTDIIGDTLWKWRPGIGREVVVTPTGHANGMTIDGEGRLVVAGWCARNIWRREHDGSIVVLASRFGGKKFNSPNDIVVRRDGSIYWTDSVGGLIIPGMVAKDVQRYLDVQGVFRLSPDGRDVSLVIDDCTYPNGLAFSPDESLLYVNDTRLALIRAFDVRPDGSVGAARVFHRLAGSETGVADGMKLDIEGNVYCTGPGGVHVIDAQGSLLGRLRMHDECTNVAFGGDDWRSLFITTFDSVYRTRVRIPGVPVGPEEPR
jgi:gluconolactonase